MDKVKSPYFYGDFTPSATSLTLNVLAEGKGFEPLWTFALTVFKTAPL